MGRRRDARKRVHDQPPLALVPPERLADLEAALSGSEAEAQRLVGLAADLRARVRAG